MCDFGVSGLESYISGDAEVMMHPFTIITTVVALDALSPMALAADACRFAKLPT